MHIFINVHTTGVNMQAGGMGHTHAIFFPSEITDIHICVGFMWQGFHHGDCKGSFWEESNMAPHQVRASSSCSKRDPLLPAVSWYPIAKSDLLSRLKSLFESL